MHAMICILLGIKNASLRDRMAAMFAGMYGPRVTRCLHADHGELVMGASERHNPDLILVDHDLPTVRGGPTSNRFGLETASALGRKGHAVVLLTASEKLDDDLARALQAGLVRARVAVTFLREPGIWAAVCERVLGIKGQGSFLLGQSPTMVKVREQLAVLAARTGTAGLLLGESGTGKSLAARWIHQHGAWADRPFLPVDCTYREERELGSELFGHMAGAATGHQTARQGVLTQAKGGTVYLYGIHHLTGMLQARLREWLDTGALRPRGGEDLIPAPARLLAGVGPEVNPHLLKEGVGLQKNLLFRLTEEHLVLPPLRERGQDLFLLAEAILIQACADCGRTLPVVMSVTLKKRMTLYPWPGNVRELHHLLRHAVFRLDPKIALLTDLDWPFPTRSLSLRNQTPVVALGNYYRKDRESFWRDYRILSEQLTTQEEIAKMMKISRTTLYRWLKSSQGDGEKE